MSTFDIGYENGLLFHKIFGKSGYKVVKVKKWKTKKLEFFWVRKI